VSVFDHRCADCQLCPACGKSAWCEGDRILSIPCEHHGYCSDCNLEQCIDCRLEAERKMYQSGVYDPRADPFYLPEKKANADAYVAAGPREIKPGVFIYPGHPSYPKDA
jgi:hypothetical protein